MAFAALATWFVDLPLPEDDIAAYCFYRVDDGAWTPAPVTRAGQDSYIDVTYRADGDFSVKAVLL